MNLTEKGLLKLSAGKERAHFYDDEVTGFGIRVDPNGRKSFFWRAKVGGTVRFRALGEVGIVTLKDARDEARKLIGVAAEWKRLNFQGDDPFAKKQCTQRDGAPLFGEMVEAYIEHRVREHANRPDRAECNVRWAVKKHFSGWLDRKIDDIKVQDVLAVKNACGQRRTQANRCVEFVRTIFNWASKGQDGKVNFWQVENPAKDVSRFEEKTRERYLLPAELAAFNDVLRKETHKDLGDFLTLTMNTGARRSDIFSMRWQNIQWEREVWRVPHPKNGEAYDVSLLPAALAVLKRRRQEISESEPHVFPGTGKTGHLTDLKKQWTRFRKAAAIPDIRVHDLRRTVGSYMAMSGINLPQIGAALGHRSLQSTQVYARLHDASIRAAREAGQQKMLEMMQAAKKRAKLRTGQQKLLAARTRA